MVQSINVHLVNVSWPLYCLWTNSQQRRMHVVENVKSGYPTHKWTCWTHMSGWLLSPRLTDGKVEGKSLRRYQRARHGSKDRVHHLGCIHCHSTSYCKFVHTMVKQLALKASHSKLTWTRSTRHDRLQDAIGRAQFKLLTATQHMAEHSLV